MPALVVLSSTGEDVLQGRHPRCTDAPRVGSLDELVELLATIEPAATPRSLDLVGHTTREAKLLRIGTTILDLTVPAVARSITRIARERLLARANLTSVRLLGCVSASSLPAQLTMKLLAHDLGVPVWGSRIMLMKSHYDARGLRACFAHVLVEASQLTYPLPAQA